MTSVRFRRSAVFPVTRARQLVLVMVLTVVFTAVAGSAGPSDRIFFVPIDLGTLGGSESIAVDVNANGQVIGDSYLPVTDPRLSSEYHAVLWQPISNLGCDDDSLAD